MFNSFGAETIAREKRAEARRIAGNARNVGASGQDANTRSSLQLVLALSGILIALGSVL